MHILIIGTLLAVMGTLIALCAPLVDRFDVWLNGPIEEDEIIVPQAKVFDHDTSQTRYYEIELTTRKSATG